MREPISQYANATENISHVREKNRPLTLRMQAGTYLPVTYTHGAVEALAGLVFFSVEGGKCDGPLT